MKPPFFVLAPMDDVTDTVFRRIIHDCAPADLYISEFVNVDGLCSSGRDKLLPKLSTRQDNGKVIAQLWGKNPENFRQIAYEIANGLIGDSKYEAWLVKRLSMIKTYENQKNLKISTKSEVFRTRMQLAKQFLETTPRNFTSTGGQIDKVRFYGIDLNFGCPDKSVLKNDCCSALAQPELRDKAVQIIKATQKGAGKLPVSIKARLGFDKIDFSWHKLLLEQKPSMLTVHMRTTRQMSKVPAQWFEIEKIIQLRDKISPKTKIVMNGDIKDRIQGEELAKKHGVDGIMIGRGVFNNPYCFAESSKEAPWKGAWGETCSEDKVNLLIKHLELFKDTYGVNERKYAPLKKFIKIYISDFDGAVNLRNKLMSTNSPEETLSILRSK